MSKMAQLKKMQAKQQTTARDLLQNKSEENIFDIHEEETTEKSVESTEENVEVKSSNKEEKVNFKQTLAIIKNNDQLVVFIGIVLAMNLILQICSAASLYYFKYVIGNEKLNQVFYVLLKVILASFHK